MPQTNAQEFKITEATIFAERFEEEIIDELTDEGYGNRCFVTREVTL